MLGKTILLIDDDSDLLQAISARCSDAGAEVRLARNLLTAASMVERRPPDLICVDVKMPTGNGLQFCEMLRGDPQTDRIPIVVFTGCDDADTTEACRRLNAHRVMKQPQAWIELEPLFNELLATPGRPVDPVPTAAPADHGLPAGQPEGMDKVVDDVFALLGSFPELMEVSGSGTEPDPADEQPATASPPQSEQPWILCVDDDAHFTEALQCRFEALGVSVVKAFEGRAGFRTAFAHPANAILLDFNMPNGNGDYVLRRLKDNPVTKDIPVVVITGQRSGHLQRTMLNMGAEAYLTKPIGFEDVRAVLARFIPELDRPACVAGAAASGQDAAG